MRIILLQDVKDLGEKYEVKEVKNGFARNFLIPKGLAKLATKENLKWLETQKEIKAKKAEEELKKVQEKAKSVDGQEIINDKFLYYHGVNVTWIRKASFRIKSGDLVVYLDPYSVSSVNCKLFNSILINK